MISDQQLETWKAFATCDDWYRLFVASDIRQMLGEIDRLRLALEKIRWTEGVNPIVFQIAIKALCAEPVEQRKK